MFSFVVLGTPLSEIVAPTPRRQILEAIRRKDDGRVEALATEAGGIGDVDSERTPLGGLPILHAACAQDLGRGVAALVKVGNTKSRDGITGQQACGARVNAPVPLEGPFAGDAPLHVCGRADASEAAAVLVYLGADATAVDAVGRDAYAVASPRVLAALPEKKQPPGEVAALKEEVAMLRSRLAAMEVGAPHTPERKPRGKPRSAWSDRDEVRRSERVLAACSETAKAFASPASRSHRVKKVFDALCALKPEDARLEAVVARVKADETLRNARAFVCGHSAYDGASLLHAVAAKGRDHVVQRLLAPDVGLSASGTLDTLGRTALHVAAEHGHVSTCAILKRAMERETGECPVGPAAPPDLSGRTPLAWASDRVQDADRREEIEAELFAEGDATVLPTPLRTTDDRRDDDEGRRYAASTTAGWRVDMEDAHCVHSPLPRPSYVEKDDDDDFARPSLFAVFDGHGGALCAELAASRLADKVLETTAWRAYETSHLDDPQLFATALRDGLLALDAELANHPRLAPRAGAAALKAEDDSGCTAVAAILSSAHVVVANLGDSAAVKIARVAPSRWRWRPGGWTATPVSVPHKPDHPAEAARLAAIGATVDDRGYLVLNDSQRQATSRSLGDFAYKRKDPAKPDLDHAHHLVSALATHDAFPRARDTLLILASDGVWDVCGPDQAAQLVGDVLFPRDDETQRQKQSTTSPFAASPSVLAAAADELVAACVRARSRDNVTAILVDVSPPLLPSDARLDKKEAPRQSALQPTKLFTSSSGGEDEGAAAAAAAAEGASSSMTSTEP
ncbi:hypothetical protein CTAYLR_007089 [Chrysophaeum taylorii]|uniref:PPM-type phosphatase domain-containing protein n=1 Tax=Chrysophaeum taylorii TaxID=2483200 RepID=A0AAD7UM15_9STRA|nr:hypothetical protein CTAYLR_007089 [Chrysophaeum taylorii]